MIKNKIKKKKKKAFPGLVNIDFLIKFNTKWLMRAIQPR